MSLFFAESAERSEYTLLVRCAHDFRSEGFTDNQGDEVERRLTKKNNDCIPTDGVEIDIIPTDGQEKEI